MNDEALLTLHCPQCQQLAEAIVETTNLICLECGWRYDDKTAARYLGSDDSATGPVAQTGR